MGCLQSAPGLHAYYSPSGELISHERPKKHSAKREYQYVQGQDAKRFFPNDECYLLSTIWHDTWLDFVLNRSKTVPGTISNHVLMDGSVFRHSAKPKKDFRPINKAVWEYFFHLYGGGPVLIFRVPEGFTEEEILKGTWLRKVVYDQIITIISPSDHPVRVQLTQGTTTNPLAENTASTAALGMLASHKLSKAKEVQAEINQANAETAALLMNKDRGKNMLKAGLEKEKEANEAQAHTIAHMFAENTAEKQLQESLAAKQQAEESQKNQVSAVFAAGNLKAQFRAALKTKNAKLMRELAARMLQNAWKGRQAKKRVRAMKAERERLMREGYARKLQCRYRAHLSRKKVARLKAEKQRLKEEGCAIMLQSAWRIKQSRAKVNRLKAEKQRLMEEFAALKVQCAWRRRKARQRLGDKRNERDAAVEKRKRSAFVVCRALRAARSKNIMLGLIKQSRLVVHVRLQRADDVMIADVNSSDPYVFVHVDQPPLSGAVDLSHKSRAFSTAPLDGGHTWSLYRSTVIYNTLHPVWNEDCMVVLNTSKDSMPELSKVVFTVMDKDNFTSDDFLGQVAVPLEAKGAALYAGHSVPLEKVPIAGMTCPLRDAKGKRAPLQNTEHNGKGFLFASMQLGKHWKCYHGWMQKLASSKIGFSSPVFKPRFVVLTEGKLFYFEDELSLDKPRGVLDTRNVSVFTYLKDKNGDGTLHLKAGDEEWTFHWMEGELREVQQAWLRRLQYNIPRAKLNAQNRQLDEIVRGIPALVDSIRAESLATPKKATRRVSSFFGTA